MSQQPTRRTNPSTPHTIPPTLAKLETWHKAAILLAALLGLGASGWAYLHSRATVAQVEEVRNGAAAALSAAQAGSTAQLGALQATVQELRTRQAAVDATVNALHDDVARLGRQSDVLYLQLVEVARSTGARRVPMPEPDASHPP